MGWDAENDEGLGVKVHEIDTLSSMEMVIDGLMTLICKDAAIEVQKMRLQLQEDKKAMTGRLEQSVNAMDCSWRGLKPKMHLGIKTLVQWTFIQNTGVSSLVHQCIHGLYLNFAFIKIFREDQKIIAMPKQTVGVDSCLHDAWFYKVWDPGTFSVSKEILPQTLEAFWFKCHSWCYATKFSPYSLSNLFAHEACPHF